MTEIKNVGRFEQLMLTVIGSITAAYFAEGLVPSLFNAPTEIAAVFVVAVIGYFINRSILTFERYMDNLILLKRLEVERAAHRESEPGSGKAIPPSTDRREDSGLVP